MQLHNLAINPEKIKQYQVLYLPSPENCSPENFENTKPIEKLCYTPDYDKLYRLLKKSGIKCANYDDLGIDAEYQVKKAFDYLYLGALWILSNVVMPIIIQEVRHMVREKKKEAGEPNLQMNIKDCNIIYLFRGWKSHS
ncbi:MAG TPA: hypothetical protein VEG44_08765 [Candidatus Acidoferrales bacterium]|nr:hypothetical protein [Candidatus Acidoferrales bacterium]